MGEDLLDHHRVFDTGDDLYGSASAFAGFDVDVAYRDVGQGREQDAEALNTRFRRCAQVMAARRSAGVVSCATSAVRALLPLPRLHPVRDLARMLPSGQPASLPHVSCRRCQASRGTSSIPGALHR